MAEHQSSNASVESGGNKTEGDSSSTVVDYVDYADEVESTSSNAGRDQQQPLLDSTEDGSNAAGASGSAEQNFPVKLHYLLGDMEKDGLDHIVSWQTHGRSFTVHKPKDFAKLILPLWFRQSKFSSFQRQLNLYSFKRITTGPDKGSYYHENFLRGKRFLCFRIKRLKIKGTRSRKPSTPENEPNFYLMPFLSPTKAGGVSAAAATDGAGAGVVANNNMTTKNSKGVKKSQGKQLARSSQDCTAKKSSSDIPFKANSPLIASNNQVPNLASLTAPFSADSLALLADLRRQQQQQHLLSQNASSSLLSLFPNSLPGFMFAASAPHPPHLQAASQSQMQMQMQMQMDPAVSLAAAWLRREQQQLQQQQATTSFGAGSDLTSTGAVEAAALILAMRRRQHEQDQVVENLLLAHQQQQQQQQRHL